jgi:leader peptidase (prepilin peptidase)/N-methyltransferase
VTAGPAFVALGGACAAAVTDLRTGIVPDRITQGTALLALALGVASGAAPAACAGAYAVGGALLVLHLLTRGHGLGLGDVKLGTAIGTGLGAAFGGFALVIAFVTGAAYGVSLLATRRARRTDAIPFAPFLATGTLISVCLAFGAVR